MRGLIVIGLVVWCLAMPVKAHANETENLAVAGTTFTVIETIGGLTIGWVEAIPHAMVISGMIVGPYLEWKTDCAKRGLQPYQAKYNHSGNRGFVVGGPAMASEENVKWERTPGSNWKRRRCQ